MLAEDKITTIGNCEGEVMSNKLNQAIEQYLINYINLCNETINQVRTNKLISDESRVEVVSVSFTGDADGVSGLLKPTVKVRITDG